jgi:hypothetical protein
VRTWREPPSRRRRPTSANRNRRWWRDLGGYWRDEVLKDLTKHFTQILVGLFVAIFFGVIKLNDQSARVLAGVAMDLEGMNPEDATTHWRRPK